MDASAWQDSQFTLRHSAMQLPQVAVAQLVGVQPPRLRRGAGRCLRMCIKDMESFDAACGLFVMNIDAWIALRDDW